MTQKQNWNPEKLVTFIQSKLKKNSHAQNAQEMAAYMKTEMPFYGVKKPTREEILKEVKKHFAFESANQYKQIVQTVWALPHREEKYMAIRLARFGKKFMTAQQISLYKKMMVEGAWWDLVDEVAIHLFGIVWMGEREKAQIFADKWIDDKNMWLRRTAIVGQIKHKAETDSERLFDFCLRRAHEQEFFIQKAIGWSLREYGKTEPQKVLSFVQNNQNKLSKLSFREASRNLLKDQTR